MCTEKLSEEDDHRQYEKEWYLWIHGKQNYARILPMEASGTKSWVAQMRNIGGMFQDYDLPPQFDRRIPGDMLS